MKIAASFPPCSDFYPTEELIFSYETIFLLCCKKKRRHILPTQIETTACTFSKVVTITTICIYFYFNPIAAGILYFKPVCHFLFVNPGIVWDCQFFSSIPTGPGWFLSWCETQAQVILYHFQKQMNCTYHSTVSWFLELFVSHIHICYNL